MGFKGDFQKQLDDLIAEAKRFDLELVAEWGDEYGGRSSVTINPGDRVYFRNKASLSEPKLEPKK
jgi:hypothetical protein